jgi:hypothetical protein
VRGHAEETSSLAATRFPRATPTATLRHAVRHAPSAHTPHAAESGERPVPARRRADPCPQLLNHILEDPNHGLRFAIIENEFGDVGVDERILSEKADEEVIEVMNGCICCTVQRRTSSLSHTHTHTHKPLAAALTSSSSLSPPHTALSPLTHAHTHTRTHTHAHTRAHTHHTPLILLGTFSEPSALQVRGDLVVALKNLYSKISQFDAVIIETTGEMQPRCSRDAAEMQPRCSRDAAEF